MDVIAAVLVAVAIVGAFEFLLVSLGICLFPHLDTPSCASTDPFCLPGKRQGLTPRIALLGTGDLAALVVVCAVLVLERIRRRN